jgi:hypothetical protein
MKSYKPLLLFAISISCIILFLSWYVTKLAAKNKDLVSDIQYFEYNYTKLEENYFLALRDIGSCFNKNCLFVDRNGKDYDLKGIYNPTKSIFIYLPLENECKPCTIENIDFIRTVNISCKEMEPIYITSFVSDSILLYIEDELDLNVFKIKGNMGIEGEKDFIPFAFTVDRNNIVRNLFFINKLNTDLYEKYLRWIEFRMRQCNPEK